MGKGAGHSWATHFVAVKRYWVSDVVADGPYGWVYGDERWEVEETFGQLECVDCGKLRWISERKSLTGASQTP